MSDIQNESQNRTKPVVTVLRWFAFVPAAIMAAALAQFVANILNAWSMRYMLGETLYFLGKVGIVFIGNAVFGAVLVLVGVFVAPAHKRVVATVLAGLLLVGAGAVVVLALLSQQYWDIFGTIASSMSGIVVAVSIHRGEILIQKESEPVRQLEDLEPKAAISQEMTHEQHKALVEKAKDAPSAFRIPIDVVQRQLEQAHPQVMLLPSWSAFQMAGTVAGCVALSLRLHFEVTEDQQGHIELAMRRILEKRFPKSERAYGDCYRFVTESLREVPRREWDNYQFVLLGMWTLAAVADGGKIAQQELIVELIAEAYQNEADGFWLQPYNGPEDMGIVLSEKTPSEEHRPKQHKVRNMVDQERPINNKWRYGKVNFDLGQINPGILAGNGIIPVPAVLDSSLGDEVVLLLVDHTPFIYRLARLTPFELQLKPGCAKTTHGPVMFFLFTVPNPVNGQPFVLIDAHANPFNEQHVWILRTLANQSHWHLILIDAKHEQVGFYEFPNIYNLSASLDLLLKSCHGMPHDDFNAAKREFSRKYAIEQLVSM
jgi:hypothetical protein